MYTYKTTKYTYDEALYTYKTTKYTYDEALYTYKTTKYTYNEALYTYKMIKYTNNGALYTYKMTKYTYNEALYTYKMTKYTYNTPLYAYNKALLMLSMAKSATSLAKSTAFGGNQTALIFLPVATAAKTGDSAGFNFLYNPKAMLFWLKSKLSHAGAGLFHLYNG